MSEVLAQVDLSAFLIYTAVAVYLLACRAPTMERNLCGGVILCLALWSFCEAQAHLSQSAERAFLWFSFGSFGWIIFPLPLLFLYLAITRGTKPNFKVLALPFLLCGFLITAQWRGNLIREVIRAPFGWIALWADSTAFYIYVIYCGTVLSLCGFLALKFWLEAKDPRRRTQGKVLFFTVALGGLIGFFSEVAAPLSGMFRVPPLACVAGLIWAIGIVLAVTKYGLLSIELGYFRDLYERLFESVPDPVALFDEEGVFLSVNRAMTESLGLSREELIGKSLRQVLDAEVCELRVAKLKEALNSGQMQVFEDERDGRYFKDYFVPVFFQDAKKKIVLVIARDITEEVKAMQRLEFYALHDYLTGLPNRAMLESEFNRMASNCDENSLMAVLFIDLDNFKSFNDTLGHDGGDEILMEVGKRLSQKTQGGVVGRFGGDEFVLILPNIKDVDQVKRAISEIISAFKAPLRAKGIDIHLSPSVGISFYPKDGTSFDELVRYADVAMYRAKRSGAGSYCFFE